MSLTEEVRKQILEKNHKERTRTIVYTRVMGYCRPVESFNIGKTGEHRERKLFNESNTSI